MIVSLAAAVIRRLRLRRAAMSCALVATCLAASPASSATYTWNVTSGTWSTAGNWGGTAPTASDTAYFSGATVGSSNATVLLSGNVTVGGLSFNNAGTTTLQSNSTTGRTFTIGTGGISMASGAGAVTIGVTGSAVNVVLNGTQTWKNDSSSLLSVLGTINTAGSVGSDLTIDGSGATTLSGIISGAAGRLISLRKQGTGALTLSAANTFTGGFTLSSGTVILGNAAALGGSTNVVTISGGAIDVTSALTTSNYAQNWNNSFTFLGSNTLNLGTGAVTLGANRTVIVNASTLTVGGAIGDNNNAYSLTKDGAGALVLGGANTFSGGVTLAKGTLIVGGTSALGTGTLTITSGTLDANAALTNQANNAQKWNGDFSFAGSNALDLGTGAVTLGASPKVTITSNTLTVGGVISGAGFGLTKDGAGTLVLNGNNTFTGGVTLQSGVLGIGNNSALGSGTVTITSGSLDAVGADRTLSGNNVHNWNGNVGFVGSNNLNLGAGAVTLGVVSSTVTVTSSTLTVGGAIREGGAGYALTKAGVGTLVLSGSNSYTGTTTVNAGMLQVAGTTALYGGNTASWTRTNITTGTGATLAVNVGGAGEFDANAVTTLLAGVGGTVSSNGLRAGSRVGLDTTNATGGFSFGGTIADTAGTGGGNVGFIKLGSGTLTLTGSNSYTGGTTLNAGTLIVGNTNALGSTTTGTLAVNNGTLNLNGYSVAVFAISGSSGATITTSTAAGTATLSIANGSGYNTAYAGVITDNGQGVVAFKKTGAGSLTLSASNSYSGGSTFAGTNPTISLGENSSLGTGLVTLSNPTTFLALKPLTDIKNNFTLNGSGTAYGIRFSGSNAITLTGTLEQSGQSLQNNVSAGTTVTIGDVRLSTSTSPATLAISGSGNTIFAGVIRNGTSSGAVGSLTITNTGTTTLSATNTFTGNLTNSGSGGRLVIGGAGQLVGSTGTYAGNISVGAGSTFQYGSTANSILSGTISGGGTIIQSGSGVLTLLGANTYTGATTVNAGALKITDAKGLGFGGPTFLNDSAAAATIAPSGSGVAEATLDLSGGITVNKAIGLTGANTTAKLINSAAGTTAVLESGVMAATFTGSGSNFSLADTGKQFSVSGGGGSGATVSIASLATTQGTFTVNNSGTGWAIGNTVTISGGGATTSAVYNVTGTGANGSLTELTLVTPGVGFTTLSGLTYTGAKGTASANFSGTNATFSQTDGTLVVNSISVGSAGSGYMSNPTLSGTAGTGSGFSGSTTIASVTLTGTNNQIGGDGNLTIKSAIGEAGSGAGFTKIGGGVLTLSASNSYTGPTTVSAGTLEVGGANALPSATAATVGGGVLNSGSYAPSVSSFTITSGSLTGSGTVTSTSGYALRGGAINAVLGSGAITVSTGTTTLGSAGRFNSASSLTVQSGQLTLSGSESVASFVLSGGVLGGSGNTLTSAADYDVQSGSVLANLGGSVGLVKSTGGTVTLSGANTYSGQTSVSAGVLALGAANVISDQSNLQVNGGGFNLAGFSDTVGAVTLTSGSIFGYGTLGGSSYALQGGALNAVLGSGAIAVSAGTTTLGSGGRFNSASALTISGGQLTLNGNESVASYSQSGGTLGGSGTVTAATYALQGGTVNANLGTGTVNVTAGTTTLGGSAAASAINVTSGGLALGGSGLLSSGATLTVNGGVLDTTASNYTATVGTFSMSSGSVNGGGTITANTYGLSGGTLSAKLGTGAITVSTGTTTLGSGGRFNSSSGLTISSGQLTLGGSESVASFVLAGGVLNGSGKSLTSAANYDMQSGSVLANLGGSAALVKSTSGTVTLSGANTHSGGTQIANGTLRLGSSTALPTSSAVTLGTGSTAGVLDFNTNTVTLGTITFNGSGSQLSPGGKLNLLAGGTNNATITVSSGSHALHPDTSLQSDTVIDVASNALFSLHGKIDGTKSLTKLGSGTLAISGANSYSGGSFLSGGYVSALSSGALGSGTVTIGNNTTLNLNNTILNNAVVFASGSGAIINSGTALNVTGTYAITSGTGSAITTSYNVLSGGDISFVSNVASTVVIQSGAAGSFTADVLAGAPAASVFVNAGGRGTFSGSVIGDVTTSGSSLFSNSVVGDVTVGGGTATFAGSTDAGSTINVNAGLAVFTGTIGGIAHATASGATIEIRNQVLSTADVNAEAGGIVKLMGSQAFDGTTIDNDGLVIVDRTANLVLAAAISGSGSLTKSDATTLTLTRNNTFTGLTTISGGTLAVGSGGASGALAGNVVNNAALVFNRSDATTYAGIISGSGLVRLLNGSLTLSSSNSYSGGTWIDGGILTAGDANAFGLNTITLGSGATLNLNGLTVGNTIVNNGGTIIGGTIIGPVSGTTVLSGGQTTFNSSIDNGARVEITATGTATFGNNGSVHSGATVVNDGVIRVVAGSKSNPFVIGSGVSGSGRLEIASGVTRIDAANDYTGNTVISGSGSVLVLSGSGSFARSQTIVVGNAGSTGAVLDLTAQGGADKTFTFNADQKVMGKGTIDLDGATLRVLGTLAPGNSPGNLTIQGNLAWQASDAGYQWEINNATGVAGTNWDLLTVTGVLDLSALSATNKYLLDLTTLTSSNTAGLMDNYVDGNNYTWSLVTASSVLLASGTAAAGTDITDLFTLSFDNWKNTKPSAGNYSVKVAGDGAGINLVIIPEPDTIIFACIGIAMAGWSLSKRRRIAHMLRHHRHAS